MKPLNTLTRLLRALLALNQANSQGLDTIEYRCLLQIALYTQQNGLTTELINFELFCRMQSPSELEFISGHADFCGCLARFAVQRIFLLFAQTLTVSVCRS